MTNTIKKKSVKKKLINKNKSTPVDHHVTRYRRVQCEDLQETCLRFTASAWAKLVYLCHHGETEIGGFGIATPSDLLLVEALYLPHQETTSVTVGFHDESVADFFEDQVIAGRSPEQFGRIWIHTHPGHCPNPSSVDEETFARVFGGSDWAVMFILARGGATYTRLRFNTGPGGSMEIPAKIDFHHPFTGSDQPAWEAEYRNRVRVQQTHPLLAGGWDPDESIDLFAVTDGLDLYDEIDLDPFEFGDE